MKAIAPCLAKYTTVYMRLALGITFLAAPGRSPWAAG
jgi:hypothetical protein